MAILIIGHRGCPPLAPENSLAGIRAAADLGVDGVEIDVRRAADGVPVLVHDWSLRRMTGWPGPVRLYPSFVLRRIRLRGSEERIPTLAEALDILPDGLFVAVHIRDAGGARPVLRLIRERGMEARVRLWSSVERAIRTCVGEAPEIETTLLRDDTDPEGLRRFLDDAVDMGTHGVSPHWAAVNPQFVGEAHDRGLRVYAMNRDLASVARKAATGLDGIITEQPQEVRAILKEAALL